MENKPLNQERYFSVKPDPQSVDLLHDYFESNAISRLSELVKSAAVRLAMDPQALLKKVVSKPEGVRLSHTVYCTLFEIELAIATGQWNPLRALLNAFSKGDGVWHRGPMEICAARDDGYDAKLIDQWTRREMLECGNEKLEKPTVLPAKRVKVLRQVILEVLNETRGHVPDYIKEIETNVTSVRLFQGGEIRGVSDPRAFGAIFLKAPDEEEKAFFLEHLIHEAAHLHLNILLSIDPILTNDREERYSSPIRSDARPALGLLHQVFVLSRLEHALKAALNSGVTYEGLERRYEENHRLLAEGLPLLEKHAKVTPLGRALLETMGIDMNRREGRVAA